MSAEEVAVLRQDLAAVRSEVMKLERQVGNLEGRLNTIRRMMVAILTGLAAVGGPAWWTALGGG